MLLTVGGCSQSANDKKTETALESSVQSDVESALQESSKEESSDKEEVSESSEILILESNTVQPSVVEFSLDNNRPFDTIEEYLQTDSAKEMIRQLTQSDDENVIHTAVFAEGGTRLVFERQLSKDFNLWLKDDFMDNIGKQVESKEDVFVALIDELETCINKKVITVVVRYVDPENNVLYEHEFDNDRINRVEMMS